MAHPAFLDCPGFHVRPAAARQLFAQHVGDALQAQMFDVLLDTAGDTAGEAAEGAESVLCISSDPSLPSNAIW